MERPWSGECRQDDGIRGDVGVVGREPRAGVQPLGGVEIDRLVDEIERITERDRGADAQRDSETYDGGSPSDIMGRGSITGDEHLGDYSSIQRCSGSQRM